MIEEEARAWIRECWGVSRETLLADFADLVLKESSQQNLISAASMPEIWTRHVVDSAQLIPLAGDQDGAWLDIGSGAGFPGMIVACLRESPITLCEPRTKRAEFLADAAQALGLDDRVTVTPTKVERLTGAYPVISARAVAPLESLFAIGGHLADRATRWVLPKGKRAAEEVAQARKSWHGSFHVEQSITDPDAQIVVATNVRRRGR